MKLIALLFFILSFPLFAQDLPSGVFQIDSSHSSVVLSGNQKQISGLINIKEKFSESTFKFETGDALFESHSVSGDLNDFEVKGLAKSRGKTTEVTFRGTFLGTIEQDEGFVRIVLKLESGAFISSIFAQKPKVSSTKLHKTVMEIIQ
jgi:polyisoprenoid-binding protein YceI